MTEPNLSATASFNVGASAADLSAMRSATHVFPGRRDQVACAREFVRQVLGSRPVAEEADLLVSELSANAVLHTASGDGGAFEVTVYTGPGHTRIEVRDQGAAGAPRARSADATAEAGRGISLVELLAACWGHTRGDTGRSVFFELSWDDADQ